MTCDLGTQIYFAHPYAIMGAGIEREDHCLIRQYFPKSRNLPTVTEPELNHVMGKLTHRPRKSLGFRTLNEIFFKTKAVALQS
ncbi:MAG: hypothetical protein NPIRA05_01850 [Nitrospirales bacterium]|nr:MAG: hypothetical protein NPIRA05_01850 [Nitrospirales bacterium]